MQSVEIYLKNIRLFMESMRIFLLTSGIIINWHTPPISGPIGFFIVSHIICQSMAQPKLM